MLSHSVPRRESFLKNPLFYSSMTLVVVLLAVAFIMYSRWQERRNIDRHAALLRAEKQHEQDQIAVDQLGGKEFQILTLYASPKVIRRGEPAQVCYGVSNAKTVKLEPQPEAVWPSASHCVDVSPTKTTTYTLTIEDAAGKTLSETVDLSVR